MIFFNKKNVVKDKKKIAKQLSRISTMMRELEEAIQNQKLKTPNYHETERLVREHYNSETRILNDMIARQEDVYNKTSGFIAEVAIKHEALSEQLKSVPDIVESSAMIDFSGLKEGVNSLEKKVENIGLTYSEKTSAFLSSFIQEIKSAR
ncbi:hypothetical protein [Serratia sp. Se-RSBMAAmG]|uniref:hypothetical protein n=1 Tax=Serratia sp. Se-RSBMAAmG TaxID=3043305 RepID=UPI0024AE8EE9|nr:hypothetical protein [Serratia sp. Se-RSBMAAmG]MDI6976100.1 hypothetical protein [Serratia sp. Se-RSBMAAmG]